MRVVYACPKCKTTNSDRPSAETPQLACRQCSWTRTPAAEAVTHRPLKACLICECEDLWRQKDFPPTVGVALVGLAILLSTIAWAMYEPIWALGVLLAFAFADLLLYTFKKDVLVCYRCHARYADAGSEVERSKFDLSLNERYRQEAIRLKHSAGETPAAGA